MRRSWRWTIAALFLLIATGTVALLLFVAILWQTDGTELWQEGFDAQRSYQDVERQVAMGPRIPGSNAHSQFGEYVRGEIDSKDWRVEIQELNQAGVPVRNIIAKRGSGAPWLILGAHYDSRLKADQDPDPEKADQPVPGANDGASGVAVLIEIGRVLPKGTPGEIWLVFFDMEDNGRLPGYEWIMGSRAFVESLQRHPSAAVIVDMVGDADLNLMLERNSDQVLSRQIWSHAEKLGYSEQFIATPGHSILDDHTPFLEAGIPAVDIIDFDYPAWHTSGDTPDKVSPASLKAVGDTLLSWIEEHQQLAK